jgi:hypothetical protein
MGEFDTCMRSFVRESIFDIACAESIALYTFMGQLFAYLAPNVAVATVLGGVNHFLWNIFNGFLVPSPIMPWGWRWLNYTSGTTYVIYSLAASQLGRNEKKIVLQGFTGALISTPPPGELCLACLNQVYGTIDGLSCCWRGSHCINSEHHAMLPPQPQGAHAAVTRHLCRRGFEQCRVLREL